MILKIVLGALGCLLAWLLLLPILLLGGCVLLLVALLAELGALIAGGADSTLDAASARRIARDICLRI
jgi:hypothetical protein